jgi:hypothetical protein
MGDVEGFLELGLEVLDGEGMLAVLAAPLLVAVEQPRRGDFQAGSDVQLLGHEPFE